MSAPIIFNGAFAKLLKKALRVGSQSSDPSGGEAGDMYFSSVANAFKYHDGSTWNVFSGSTNSFAPQTKTSAYSASAWDFVLASNSAFTVTLPTAVGIDGALIAVKKTDSSLSNIITIDGNGSETIDGNATTALHTLNETIILVSDGTNWQIIERKIPSVVLFDTATTIASSGTANAKAAGGSITNDRIILWRVGREIHGRVEYKQTAGGTTGTGVYKWTMPSGITFDTGNVTAYTGTDAADTRSEVGHGSIGIPGTASGHVNVYVYDSTNLSIKAGSTATAGIYMVGGTTGPAGGTWYPFGGAVVYNFKFSVQVANWNG
jgi:hypothetical protein